MMNDNLLTAAAILIAYTALVSLLCAGLARLSDRHPPAEPWERCSVNGCTMRAQLYADDRGLIWLCGDCADVAHAEAVIPGAA